MKSLVADRSVSVPMTLSDPNPDFKVTVYLQVDHLKNDALSTNFDELLEYSESTAD